MNGEKKQLQSRWNEERGTLVEETKETQIKEKTDTPPITESKEKHFAGVSEMHAAVHPSVRPSQLGTLITLRTIQ